MGCLLCAVHLYHIGGPQAAAAGSLLRTCLTPPVTAAGCVSRPGWQQHPGRANKSHRHSIYVGCQHTPCRAQHACSLLPRRWHLQVGLRSICGLLVPFSGCCQDTQQLTSSPGTPLLRAYSTDCAAGASIPATGRDCHAGQRRGRRLLATLATRTATAAAFCTAALLLSSRCIVSLQLPARWYQEKCTTADQPQRRRDLVSMLCTLCCTCAP